VGELNEADAADRRAHLAGAASHWTLLCIGPEVVQRARLPFPGPPIRTLDAIHLASLPVARSVVAGLTLLSLDGRVRGAATLLGTEIRPRLTTLLRGPRLPPGGAHGIAIIDPERVNADLLAFIEGEMES
jgi:hypothetical protein